MGLRLYRRHRPDCEARHPEDLRSGEFEEGRKGWKRGACLIVASGTLRGRYSRRTTGTRDWDEARRIAGSWTSWTDEAPPVATPAPAPTPDRTALADAISAWLAVSTNRDLKPASLSKYRTLTKQLRAYADERGYVMIDQLTRSDMDRFFASWKNGKRGKGKKLERLRSFITFCVKRKWIAENIADDLKAPPGSSLPANKSPFTSEEMDRIYAACDAITATPARRGPGQRNWTGDDTRDFIDFAVYTGLRISDIATFDISKKLHGNDVLLRMHKTGKPVFSYIPDELVERLTARQQRFGNLIFKSELAHALNPNAMAKIWRERLDVVFEKAGAFEESPSPHRFRHTHVRILLEKGGPVADVAELIGDTEAIVRKHYSKWVTSRQDRLRGILKSAFDEKPKLTAIKGGRT